MMVDLVDEVVSNEVKMFSFYLSLLKLFKMLFLINLKFLLN